MSIRIRPDQQIAIAVILILLASSVWLTRQNQTLRRKYRESEASAAFIWDFIRIHNEKKTLNDGRGGEIVWKGTYGQHHTLKIRIDAIPAVDISIKTICIDLMLIDLKHGRSSTHQDAYEVIRDSAVEIWEREVAVAPGQWFVIASIPEGMTETTVYLEISEKRPVPTPRIEIPRHAD